MIFFVLLYFVQGIALAYFTGYQKRYLASEGIPPDKIAILTVLVLLPFVLKPLIGLFIDALSIQRKSAIYFGLILATLSFGAANFTSPFQAMQQFSFAMIMASFGIAIFDTMADALAVDSFQSSEFSSIQSAMLAGKSLGIILFSIFFGLLIDQSGYKFIFLMLSFSMLIPLFLLKSVKGARKKDRFYWSDFKILKSQSFLSLALFGILYSIPSFGISGLFSYFLSSIGYSALKVGWMESIKSIGALIGAIVFPLLIARLRFQRFLVYLTIASGLVASIFSMAISSTFVMGFFIGLFGLLWALRETLYTTLSMKITKPSIAASMFSLLMAFSNLGTSIGEGLATSSSGHFGFPTTFVIFGLLNLSSLIFLKTKLFRTQRITS